MFAFSARVSHPRRCAIRAWEPKDVKAQVEVEGFALFFDAERPSSISLESSSSAFSLNNEELASRKSIRN